MIAFIAPNNSLLFLVTVAITLWPVVVVVDEEEDEDDVGSL